MELIKTYANTFPGISPMSESAPSSNWKRFHVLGILVKTYPRRTAVILGAMFIAGLAESIGLLSLLPFLELTVGRDGEGRSELSDTYRVVLDSLGLDVTIPIILAAIVILILMKAALTFFAMSHIGNVLAQMAAELRANLIQSALQARWSFFVKYPIGRFVNAVSTEVPESTSTYRASCQFLAALLQAALLLSASFLISPGLTLAAFVAGILMMLLLGYFVTLARQAGHDLVTHMQALTSRLADGLQGIKPLKAMNCERWLVPLLESETHDLYRTMRLQVRAKYGLSILREPIVVMVLVIGFYIVLTYGQMPIAELLTMAVLFHRISVNLGLVQQAFQQIGASEHFYWSVHSMNQEALKERENFSRQHRVEFLRAIEIRELSHLYGSNEVLRGVSAIIPQQTFTAVIGPSGAGKTTLVDLICGLLHPSRGQILIDGMPLEKSDLALWRQQIGYVPQELFLFHDSILNNVSLSDPGVDQAIVEQSIKDAGAWEFVSRLEKGVHTVIGERGLLLSGGQRQRLAIARALARRPQLLILDEATTALDPHTEAEICRTLQDLSKNVSVLAISHQPAIVEMAERVYRLENGTAHQVK
ncbi:MAG: ABC transporter ATP-binding protein [Nitrospirales bacterium]|nr:MAG: ABC transporter ATP-binding protein [Nitrospirales bacterium]